MLFNHHEAMARWLIIAGLILVIAGILLYFAPGLFKWFGSGCWMMKASQQVSGNGPKQG